MSGRIRTETVRGPWLEMVEYKGVTLEVKFYWVDGELEPEEVKTEHGDDITYLLTPEQYNEITALLEKKDENC